MSYRTGCQIYVFLVVGVNEGLYQKDIVKALKLEKATVAKAVKKLREDGYVRTEEDPDDKRYTKVFLNSEGRRVFPSVIEFFKEVDRILLQGFYILMGFGVIGFISCLFMDESAPMTEGKSLMKTLGNLGKVIKNSGFTYPLLLFSTLSFPMMLFLAASSNIYIIGFGLNEQIYSLFFGGLMAFFISLDWNNRILVYGKINIAVGLLCSAFWPKVWKKCSTD